MPDEEPSAQERLDRRTDRTVAYGTVLVAFAVLGIGTVPLAAYQSVDVGGDPAPADLLPDMGLLLVLDLLLLVIGIALVAALRPVEHRGARLAADVAVICLVCGAARVPLQVLLGFYGWGDWDTALVEGSTVAIFALAMLGAGLVHVSIRRRVRDQERTAARQELRAAAALDALATEELRVRREVAEGLHGTVQQNLVVLGTRMDVLSGRLAAGEVEELRSIRAGLDEIREHDVRTMSQLLYPVGLELGAVAALRLLLQRLPATIATTVSIGEEVLALEGNGNTALSLDRRILLVRVVEEGLSNSLRHGRASAIAVTLEASDGAIVLTFDDDGFGLGAVITPHGIARLRERLQAVGGEITLSGESGLGGTRLVARIPVRHG